MTDMRELFLIDPKVRYFNHGALGAVPRTVLDRYHRLQLEVERQPEAFQRTVHGRLRAARGELAEFVGADRDDVAFCTNSTTAMNAVFRSLDLAPGENEFGIGYFDFGDPAMVTVLTVQSGSIVWGASPFAPTWPDATPLVVPGSQSFSYFLVGGTASAWQKSSW